MTEDKFTPEQHGQALRFFLEKHDQGKFRREVDSKAEIPGQDPFDIILSGEELPQKGILVSAKAAKGFEAVVDIYAYDNIRGVDLNDSRPKYDQVRMYVNFESEGEFRELSLAYENPNYFYKDKPPYDRMSPTSYIGYGFDSLDTHNLSDGGRLLIQKKANETGGLSTSFDRFEKDLEPDSPNREVLRLFSEGDINGAAGAVETIMAKVVGANQQDAELISGQVKTKLGEKK